MEAIIGSTYHHGDYFVYFVGIR